MPAATVVACVGTHCSTNLASSGPQMTRVGAATRSPKSRVSPRSAPSASIATSGPGWGGTRPCRIDSPARAGIPTRMIGMSRRRATRITTGTSRTTPTSKNSGSPRIAAISAIAQGSPAGPTRPMIVSTIVSLPPESASSLPTIAPSAINSPTDPTVAPNPRVKLLTMSRGATPATAPITAVPSISARNGWNFARVINSTTAAMPRMAARISWLLGASVRSTTSSAARVTAWMVTSFLLLVAAGGRRRHGRGPRPRCRRPRPRRPARRARAARACRTGCAAATGA